ncbi:hypothetical protein OUZ56_006100 [Daphnia magna]|uniref:Uncharacterized protein n=1 Tax=Daphnia magna TaxID=35525 RepID=A0ABQ9YUN3_9CRUS|nr:hypothetical protein OUZ56_006100 [Daphnia magna]
MMSNLGPERTNTAGRNSALATQHPILVYGLVPSSKTSYVARSPQMRKSHLCPSWSAAAAASYGETNFFIYCL